MNWTTITATTAVLLIGGASCASGQEPQIPSSAAAPQAGVRTAGYAPPDLGPWPADRIDPILKAVSPERLRAWHELLASEPHVAGAPGDLRQVERIVRVFEEIGLTVEKHEFVALLARPVAGVLELVQGDKRTPLAMREKTLDEDAGSANPDLSWGWNAYSGSGDVTGEVVYANQATRADFARLKELGVNCAGRVVLCRYGGCFRGSKVKFAQEAGAAAVVIFTDVAAGSAEVYPAGGAPNDTCIERGSVNTLDYPGDPLTPGVAATADAERLDAGKVDLPRIPVQPIGWGAARAILLAMATGGASSPALPEGWQGGINAPYQLISGPSVQLRVKVEQERMLAKSYNIIGTLPGAEWPDEWVLVGAHHDAWGYGACDPTCGTICVLESARVCAAAAKGGKPPRRTVKFCCWGAEEFSIIGSTEWVESRRAEVEKNAVAYINLDMAAMGPDFGASASPSLKTLIAETAKHVPAIGATLGDSGPTGKSVLQAWSERKDAMDPEVSGQPRIGTLGGGSDHVAFWCHAGVPSCGMGGGGAKGSAYHSIYDSLAWYRKNVGDDYQSARMVTQMATATLLRLADDEAPPLDFARDMHDLAARLKQLAELADSKLPAISLQVRELAARAERASYGPGVWARSLARSSINTPARRQAWAVIRKRVLTENGLPLRPWYRNEMASPDPDSQYAAWLLPRLTMAIEHGDLVPAKVAIERYSDLIGGEPKAARPGGLPGRPANTPGPSTPASREPSQEVPHK